MLIRSVEARKTDYFDELIGLGSETGIEQAYICLVSNSILDKDMFNASHIFTTLNKRISDKLRKEYPCPPELSSFTPLNEHINFLEINKSLHSPITQTKTRRSLKTCFSSLLHSEPCSRFIKLLNFRKNRIAVRG